MSLGGAATTRQIPLLEPAGRLSGRIVVARGRDRHGMVDCGLAANEGNKVVCCHADTREKS